MTISAIHSLKLLLNVHLAYYKEDLEALLLSILDMERVDLIPEFIIACCVLHIYLLHNDDDLPIETDLVENNDNVLKNPIRRNNAGYTKRDVICDNVLM